MEIVAPIIHTNGTSREALLEQVTDAGQALRVAIDKLSEAYPNGRDYYPVPDLLRKAQAQRDAWAQDLLNVYKGLQALAEAIADA